VTIRDWSRFTKITVYGGALLAVVVILSCMVFAFSAWSRASAEREEERDRGDTIQAEKDLLQEEYNKLYKEYRDATGEKPDAPTPTEVETVVGSQGERGFPGRDGQNASYAQIADAVRNYCALGNCVGPQGAQGVAGQDGATGPQGAAGANGTNGRDGRSVSRISCEAGNYLVFYDQADIEISRINMICLG